MKLVLFIFLLSPFVISAQEECKVLKETDPYTRQTVLSSGFVSFQGCSLSINADNKEVDFFFIADGKCFSDGATVFIFFEGSKARTTWRNAGSLNCNGYFHYRYRNSTVTPTVVKKLATQKVAQFVFTANDKSQVTIALTAEQQEILMKAVACMTEQAPTLLK